MRYVPFKYLESPSWVTPILEWWMVWVLTKHVTRNSMTYQGIWNFWDTVYNSLLVSIQALMNNCPYSPHHDRPNLPPGPFLWKVNNFFAILILVSLRYYCDHRKHVIGHANTIWRHWRDVLCIKSIHYQILQISLLWKLLTLCSLSWKVKQVNIVYVHVCIMYIV